MSASCALRFTWRTAAHYERRRPEQAQLYRLVPQPDETFAAE